MDKISIWLSAVLQNKIIAGVIFVVIFDTVFGMIRAFKEHKFNSCFGIDGAIRKVSMIISIVFLCIADRLAKINLIAFVPDEVMSIFGISSVGTAEFFGLFFIAYEIVSVLKNMVLCDLPVKFIWENVTKFLKKYTDELPDEDEIKNKEVK